MHKLSRMRLRSFFDKAYVWLIFVLGLYFVVIRPLGPGLAHVPGDLGDARFSNYLLEHFYRWITGLDASFWNARFLYPYRLTVAFSDNYLGEGPVYALLRAAGFDWYAAYQGYYVLGYCFNYAAAVYVLSKFGFKPLATGAAAFFFTFGLPVLAHENHVQLLYRFCIPLACFSLWGFYQEPRLRKLMALSLFLVLQFYLSIYLGLFLVMLIATLLALYPFFTPVNSWREKLLIWPKGVMGAWARAHALERILSLLAVALMVMGLAVLFKPYFDVTRIYGFGKNWDEILSMLPTPQSYLLADHSELWGRLSQNFTDIPQRQEHQLFPGITVFIWIAVGIIGRFASEKSRLAWPNFWAAVILSVLILNVNGFSLYEFLQIVPGLDSIRAAGRVELVLLWPVSIFSAWTIEAILPGREDPKWSIALVCSMTVLLMAESMLYQHVTYNKADSEARLLKLRQQIPRSLPDQPVLFVAANTGEPSKYAEVDAMVLAQQLGWSTVNGYTSNAPGGYQSATSCDKLPKRIFQFMKLTDHVDQRIYLDLIQPVVPIGFRDCHPVWWGTMPDIRHLP